MTDFDPSAGEGHVDWWVSISGVELAAAEYAVGAPNVGKIAVTSKGPGSYELEVITSGLFTDSNAVDISRSVVEAFLWNLAVEHDARVHDARLVGHTLPYPPGDPAKARLSTVIVTRPLYIDLGPSPPTQLSERDIQTVLDKGTAPGLAGVRTSYRVGSAESDPVASFMMLYNALLQLCDDRQGGVDSVIRTHSPAVPVSPSPRFAGVDETVYTRLRNEIGHKRAGVDLARTRAEIREHLPAFRSLVRGIVAHGTA